MPDQRAQDFGARLRHAREARSVSLRQIADVTKLSVRALEGLERGDAKCLPRGIFRRALVRAYARETGLDPEATLAEFLSHFPDDLPTLVQAPCGRAMLADDVPPSRARQMAEAALKVIGAIVPIGAGALYFLLATGSPETAPPLLEAEPARVSDAWRPEIVPAGGFAEAPPPAPRPLVFFLTITSPCELRVLVDGREVVSRRFRAGEQLQVEAHEEVVLTGDDAGAVQFSINGQAGRMLGAAGQPLGVRIARDDYDAFLIGH